ncbi:ABC transporter substrate-binding protein [Cloacibacillus evryensis]|uniref:ABC transporter substrate-binding protein n=1 Tax=Cloacibacillus evryensis TaxID=508460 RepID=UPI00241E328F|nr:ABC transporter substrate-binding protein [Cloacibacillus evryensis]
MKLTKSVAVAFSLVLVMAGMAMAAETVKIGVYLPITGGNAIGGQLELDGVKLAHQQYPTVDGKKIELVVVDNKSDKVESANAVKRLIEKDKVRAIIGTYGSSLAMAGGEVAEKAGIPMVGTSCTNPLVTQGKKYVFRVCFIDPFQGAGAADYALKELKAKSAAMLIEVTEDYSVGLGNFFKQNFTKNGGKIVSVMNYQKGDQDFTAQLTEIISKKPDVLYIPANFAEGAIIMRQARELGAKFSILGGDAMDNPEMVKIGGDSVEGFSYTTFAYSPNMSEKLMSPIQKQFTAQWRKAFPGKDPAALTGCGYDAYLLIYNAIKSAKSTDPAKITAAIASTKDMPGVTGTTTINKTHDAEKSVGIIKIEKGKQVFHAIVNPK